MSNEETIIKYNLRQLVYLYLTFLAADFVFSFLISIFLPMPEIGNSKGHIETFKLIFIPIFIIISLPSLYYFIRMLFSAPVMVVSNKGIKFKNNEFFEWSEIIDYKTITGEVTIYDESKKTTSTQTIFVFYFKNHPARVLKTLNNDYLNKNYNEIMNICDSYNLEKSVNSIN